MAAATRLKVGVIFNFSGSWLGGVYYILNIIRSLNTLEDSEKPEIFVFYRKELERFTKEISYPYLHLVENEFPSVYRGYIESMLRGKNLFVDDLAEQYQIDVFYPLLDQPIPGKKAFGKKPRALAWFADLQHKFYPAFFSRRQWWLRELRLRLLLRNTTDLVVSSHDVAAHFHKFFRLRKDMRLHILQFASVIEPQKLGSGEALPGKYALPEGYFMVSNQFHNHKNHLLVWQAVQKLREQGENVTVAVTGKMENVGNDAYIRQLREFLEVNQLHDRIRLLGVIPREEQLQLMRQAKAIIQPSLFEGWSTVIEDAKSLQVPVIASNLAVNREQLGEAGHFFDPKDPDSLAEIMLRVDQESLQNGPIYEPYPERIQAFARQFMNIIQ